MASPQELSDELPRPKRKKRDQVASPREGEPADEVRHWLSEIHAAKKREDDYREQGERVRSIYAGEKKEQTPFNVLFSNTETMAPALYSAIPRPVVQRRFKDNNPIEKAAADAAQRFLEFQLDTNLDGYETFDDSLKAAVLDALLPGRGVTSVKYEAETADVNGSPVKISDNLCTHTRSWNRVYFGYAKRWADVPWVAFEDFIDKDEAIRLFGPEIAGQIQFTKGEQSDSEKKTKAPDERFTGERKTALVYQIWDRAGGKIVRYLSPQHKESMLLDAPDPLGLSGFFNIPRPLKFIEKTDDLTPTALYTLYEIQATELNSLTVRINRIVKAIKARGIYDGALGEELSNLMDAEDNELLPASSGASQIQGGLDKAIWFMPLEVLTTTLRELYASREQVKQVIYEIIGIADILRGASQASETLGAQQIKTQWGTLRLRPKQAEVQRYARDLLRMFVEIGAKQFSQDTWARMTGLPYLTDAQVQQQMVQLQQLQQQLPMMDPQMQAQAQQQMQQLQAQVKWADVLGVLKDDLQRAFKVDIETNSTIQPEAAEDQKNIADLLNALGQYLNQVAPMVLQGVLPFQAAQSMLLAITRRFRFGGEIEEQIQQMQPPKPQPKEGDGGAAAQKTMQLTAENLQLKGQLAQTQQQQELQQKAREADKREADLAAREAALQSERALFLLEKDHAAAKITNNAQMETQRIEHKKQIAGLTSKQQQQQTRDDGGRAVGQAIARQGEALTDLATQIKALVEVAPKPRKRKAA
jgi:hypothetical protein